MLLSATSIPKKTDCFQDSNTGRATNATRTTVQATCSPPPSHSVIRMRNRCARDNSIPMVNNNKATPSSAKT